LKKIKKKKNLRGKGENRLTLRRRGQSEVLTVALMFSGLIWKSASALTSPDFSFFFLSGIARKKKKKKIPEGRMTVKNPELTMGLPNLRRRGSFLQRWGILLGDCKNLNGKLSSHLPEISFQRRSDNG